MIRSMLFTLVFYLGLIIVLIVFLPSLILPQKITLFGGKILGYWSKICLKIIMSTKIIVRGFENINNNNKFFIACSHQSAFETFFLQTLFDSPIFILKKELIRLPLFGLYLKKIGSISIERNKVSRENLRFLEIIKETVKNSKRPLLIFPQATRQLLHDRSPFKKGVARIYDDLKIQCLPVAINSGAIWPKKGLLSANKTIIVSILKPIDPGKKKDDFLEDLQNIIFNELDVIS